MFVIVIRDSSRSLAPTETNNIRDIADIVVNITGSEREGWKAAGIAGHMNFYDIFISSKYAIWCFPESIRNGDI